MRTIDPATAQQLRPARPRQSLVDEKHTAARSQLRQLVAEAVIASYIHDISVRHSQEAEKSESGVKT